MNLDPYRTMRRAAIASEPLTRSVFDLYASDGALVYVKDQCGQSDIAHPFLQVVPARTEDLAENRRRYGFDNLDFNFFLQGALFDGKCAASVPLPNYAVASIRTGQHDSGRELWSAETSMRDAR